MAKNFIFFTFLLNTLFINTLFADQKQYPFLGITTSYNTVQFTPETNSSNEKETTFGLRYGKQTQDYRTVFTFSGNSNYQTFDIEVDVILMDDMFGLPEIRPYSGITLGYINYDEDLLNEYKADLTSSSSTSSDGIYYGLNFGFLVYATDTLDLDLSYHYHYADQVEPLDVIQGAKVSLHYFY